MKKILLIMGMALLTTSCYSPRDMKMVAEYAYHQGQVDALNGDVRIDSTLYYWVKSCWDDGTTPEYIYGHGKLGVKAKYRNEMKYGRK